MQATITHLTAAEADVLKAYRDDTTHTRSVAVTGRLIERGFIAPDPSKTIFSQLSITRSGRLALEAYETKDVLVY